MGKKWLINEYVRKKLKELRQSKGLTASEVAERLGLPRTSYVSMESGAYNIKLDHVYRVLAVLDADILDVWPQPDERSELAVNRSHLLNIQRFRLNEVLHMSGSAGGILLARRGGRVRVAMQAGLSDYFVDRLVYYLEDNTCFKPGSWFDLKGRHSGYFLYLRAENVPRHVEQLIEHYLSVWASFFDSDLFRETPDNS